MEIKDIKEAVNICIDIADKYPDVNFEITDYGFVQIRIVWKK